MGEEPLSASGKAANCCRKASTLRERSNSSQSLESNVLGGSGEVEWELIAKDSDSGAWGIALPVLKGLRFLFFRAFFTTATCLGVWELQGTENIFP